MKVIFLDNDGVICLANNWGSRMKKYKDYLKKHPKTPFDSCPTNVIFDNFDKKAIKVLNEILTETGAEIVVSSDWRHHTTLEEFNYQVNWEINHLRKADLILFNFEENTKAPITLWELGRFGRSNNSIVCCPTGFYRYGNVETICTIENITLFHSLDDAIGALSTKIKQITFNK